PPLHPVFRQVRQDRVVGLPAVGEFDQRSEVDRCCGRGGVQGVVDAFAADDDAGVPVAGGEDAEAAGLQVEGRGVGAAGERVEDDGDVVLAALEAVGGVDDDVRDAEGGEGGADRGRLVAVGGADGDAVGRQGGRVRGAFGGGRALAVQETADHQGDGAHRFRVGARGVGGRELQQAPA